MDVRIKFLPKIKKFWLDNPDAEIFVIAGGRSKGATWGIADKLILDAITDEHFILCTREIKGTVDHSSRRTIEKRIINYGLRQFFDFQNTQTICKLTGSRFIYTGLSKITEDNVQGLEGLTRAWLGEAHTMELSTWQKFEPTVRDNDAVVYIDYNTQYSVTPIHMLFTENPNSYPFEGKKNMPELAYLFLDYRDNIACPEKILKMAERNRKQYSKEDWEWIWYGKLRDSSDRYVCSEFDVIAAMERKLEYDLSAPFIVGCDIAHMGGDEIVFAPRRGFKFMTPRIMSVKRFNVVCDELEAFINFDKAAILVIDNGHIGAAVADEMETRGYYVERINFGGTKEMHFDKEHCKDCATDMAFNFSAMLPKLSIPYDEVLKNQITQRKWDFLKNGKAIRKIESKEEFQKHAVHLEGHKSPDRGDAHWLACYNRNTCVLPMAASSMVGVY